jgi:hypothetical protein
MCEVQCDHGTRCILSHFHKVHNFKDGCFVLENENGTFDIIVVKT